MVEWVLDTLWFILNKYQPKVVISGVNGLSTLLIRKILYQIKIICLDPSNSTP